MAKCLGKDERVCKPQLIQFVVNRKCVISHGHSASASSLKSSRVRNLSMSIIKTILLSNALKKKKKQYIDKVSIP